MEIPDAPAPRPRPNRGGMREAFDPSARQAEADLLDAPNPTVVRYLQMRERRKREIAIKPAFKQLWLAIKRKPAARRGMDKAMLREAGLKEEIRTLNKFIDKAWEHAQDCFKTGDLAGVRVYHREMNRLRGQVDRLKTDLSAVQDLEGVLVEQLSTGSLMRVHEKALHAVKHAPDVNNALEDRLDILEKTKDQHAESERLLREQQEAAPEDDEGDMTAFMAQLAQHTDLNLDTVPPVAAPVRPVRNTNQQWQPIYE